MMIHELDVLFRFLFFLAVYIYIAYRFRAPFRTQLMGFESIVDLVFSGDILFLMSPLGANES